MPKTEDKILVPEVRIILHYVPQDGPVADGNHGLGNRFRILAETHTQSSAKQYDFHRQLLRLIGRDGYDIGSCLSKFP